MADRNEVSELIDRIIRESKITVGRERAELRRELESHFAEVAPTDDALHQAIEHFGSPSVIGTALANAHRHSRFLTRVLRLACALIASTSVAAVLQLITSLRIDARGAAFALGSGFLRSLVFSAMLILVLVTAWELDIEAFCTRLERHPVRMVWAVIGLATTMIAFHAFESSEIPPPGLALTASAIDVVIWTCTVAILARTDRFFARLSTLPTPPPRG